MRLPAIFILWFTAVSTASSGFNRIVGGQLTTIYQYPTITAVLFGFDGVNFRHGCGGSILNQRSVMTAAHCFDGGITPARTRIRVGSTFSNSGGIVHPINRLIIHPNYNRPPLDSDIAIIQTSTRIVYNNAVQPARIAGTNYNLRHNDHVWAAGWGATSDMGPRSEQLRDVQIYYISDAECIRRIGPGLTPNMFCAGVLDIGGRDQCQGDSGGPVYHNGIVVGITSFGSGCASPRAPGVNVRVSQFAIWVEANA